MKPPSQEKKKKTGEKKGMCFAILRINLSKIYLNTGGTGVSEGNEQKQ
jgi:hypothetical protein